ncbi:hypothetical protein SAMN05661080_02108 [Modestobacter sp. DSM 44400]|uniref:hypothetical protein n=1 Tax=Modestobacter sp. DSM 44400 TaxID=1550230 RepID=UPI000897AE30|nr:hypothetical protein [Modestobacter sp. DSM 44400]SDY04394.1 hypothetical protein SAMN05661080_02108 [Modestobacter sp. DSM 44400]
MNQPLYWTLLAAAAACGAAARLAVGHPLLRRRAVSIGRAELGVAAVSLLALAFHCASMFFAPWTDAVPGGQTLGGPVRALGPASQVAYWVPAVALVAALRRVWWPVLALLTATLAGVGTTMFWSYPLATHLSWLAAAVVTWIVVAASLVGLRSGELPRRPRTELRPG